MADPWSLDAIVAEAEDLAYREQAEAEAKAKKDAEDKKKADELNAREAKLRAKQEDEAKITAEIAHVKELEGELYKLMQELQEARGQARKDCKVKLKQMDAVVKKARAELSREARKVYMQQAEDIDGAMAALDDAEADARAELEAQADAESRAAEARAKKRKAEEDAAYAAIRKRQADEIARQKKEAEEERLKLETMRAKYQGGKGILD